MRGVTKNMPIVRGFLSVLADPGWAPLAVVIAHVALAQYGLTDRFDHHLHFLGGASIAYFFFGLNFKLPISIAVGPRWLHYLLAFTLACTAALFWEFAEFASDQFRRTSIQQSIPETMLDLLFGVAGACVSLSLLALFSFGRKHATLR